ncbi:MAG: hypothetical protein VW474_01420, partial [Paracoccaceae bacterium]
IEFTLPRLLMLEPICLTAPLKALYRWKTVQHTTLRLLVRHRASAEIRGSLPVCLIGWCCHLQAGCWAARKREQLLATLDTLSKFEAVGECV